MVSNIKHGKKMISNPFPLLFHGCMHVTEKAYRVVHREVGDHAPSCDKPGLRSLNCFALTLKVPIFVLIHEDIR